MPKSVDIAGLGLSFTCCLRITGGSVHSKDEDIGVRAKLENDVVYLHQDDVPPFKKGGSVVRNNYFWALKAIAGHAPRYGDWEYESEVWIALKRVLLAFQESGYLGLSETQLEFPVDQFEIPDALRAVSTWQSPPSDLE